MKNDHFSFQISPYDADNLLPQVSRVLEKRTELVSRKKYPGLWKLTDQFNAMSHMRTRSNLRTRLMSILCLVLGIFLFVPGIMEPQELLVPLLAGACAIGAGIGGLWRSGRYRKNPFDRSARLLLEGKDTLSDTIEVSFSDSEMSVSAEHTCVEHVSFSSFEYIIETFDLFLLFYDTRVTALHKSDLCGTVDAFRDFISEKVSHYQALT